MKRLLAFLFLAPAAAIAQTAVDTDAPIAPIAATPFEGWTNAYTLKNAEIEVTIVPAAGRIMRISYQGGDNLLRVDATLEAGPADASNTVSWMNRGGDWFWPVAQSRWKDLARSDPGSAGRRRADPAPPQRFAEARAALWRAAKAEGYAEASWPPPAVLADEPWSFSAWRNADGSQCCLLTREYGAPIHIRASRMIRLEPGAARLGIRQTISRLVASEVPVVLWNISQVGGASHAILPVDPEPPLGKGFKPLLFDAPPETSLAACEQAIVYDTKSGEHKLCSDSKRAWIAAQKGGTLILERAESQDAEGKHPDGGCTVEMYSNTGLGYTEIETLSVEKNLKSGEYLQNTLTIECLPAPAGDSPCALTEHVRKALGELKSAIPPVK